MPGPGRGKGKSKSKPATVMRPVQGNSPAPDTVVRDIDDAEGWDKIVNILCHSFDLPGAPKHTTFQL
jgi:hypothetical protein